jgi:hypothetical protein
MPLQIRRGPTADREATIPLAGELVYDTTTGSVYVGNGVAAGGLPVTSFSVGDARIVTGRLFLGTPGSGIGVGSDNTGHSGITFAYIGDRLQATVAQDLSNYIGLIAADQGFKGNLWADDSGVGFLGGKPLVNSETGEIYGNFLAASSIIPDTNIAYDLGSSAYRFRDLYLSGSSIYLGDAVITATGTAINFPTGSTIDGQPLGINEGDAYNIVVTGNVIGIDSTVLVNTANGTFHGDLTGSVFADDSTILVDGRDGVLRGELIGTLTGNVTGNVTGNAGTASIATTVSLIPATSSTSIHYINFSLNSSGDEAVRTDTGLQYQPSTNTLSLSILNATTINVTTASATNLTGTNLFTSLIDSADSTAITVTPAMIFSSDVTIENELFIGGDVFPDTSESYSLGSYTKKFSKLYLTEGDNALWIGNAAISGNGTVVNLPAGSTVGGSAITTAAGANATTITVNTSGTSADHFISFFDAVSGDKLINVNSNFKFNPGTNQLTVGNAAIGTVTGNLTGNVTGNLIGDSTGYHNGDMKGSVFGFDSSVLVDAVDGVLRGTLIGALTGNVTGNVTGNITSSGTSSFAGTLSVGGSFTAAGGSSFSTNNYSATSMFGISQAHETADARNVTFSRARGTTSVPLVVNNGDDIADIAFVSYGNSGYVPAAQISVTVEDPTPSNSSMKAKISFFTNTGTSGLIEHVTLNSSGVLVVNTFSSGSIQISENNITGVNSNEDIVIDPSGTGTIDFQIVTQSTVGPAGIASALPVTPSTYFKIKLNGVEYVVPAYAVS